MTDAAGSARDLVKRLRRNDSFGRYDGGIFHEAADRIEQLEAALAASPSEEVEAALVAADRLAEYVEFQGRSGHNWPTTAEAQRTYITVRRALAALRTTKEGEEDD